MNQPIHGTPIPLDPVPVPAPPVPPLEGWQAMLAPGRLPGVPGNATPIDTSDDLFGVQPPLQPKPAPSVPPLPAPQAPPGFAGGPGTAAQTDTGAGGVVGASGVNSLFGHNDIQLDIDALRQQLVAVGPAAYTAEGQQQILMLLQAFLNAAGARLETSDANVKAQVAQIQRLANELAASMPPPPQATPETPKPPPPPEESARRYDQLQRAADQALVDRAHAAGRTYYIANNVGYPGCMYDEEAAAAARLRDYETITDPKSWKALAGGQDARNLAGERLNDFNQSRFMGPPPIDRVLGIDTRTLALRRMGLQSVLEDGTLTWRQGPMLADDATRLVDQGEATDRANIIAGLKDQLGRVGLSPAAVYEITQSYQHGLVPPFEYLDAIEAGGKPFGAAERALDRASDLLDQGRDWQPEVGAYTLEDIEILKNTAKAVGRVGTAVDLLTGVYELLEGKPAGEVLAKGVGGWAGMGAGALGGGEFGAWVGGPYGAFFGALLGGTAGALGGDAFGKWAYQSITR